MEPKKRIGRFARGPKPPNYDLTQNVLDILAIAARYDTVQTSRFYKLLPARSPKRIRIQLKLLYRSGYMGRRTEQRANPFAEVQHFITPEGRALLKGHGIEPHQVVAHFTQPPGEARRYHTHQLKICDVLASIEAGAGKAFITQEELLEHNELPDPLKLPCTFTYTFPSGRVETYSKGVRADGFFALDTDKRRYYVLEAENESRPRRSHFRASSFLRKVLAYQNIIVESKVYQKQLGIENLRVLVTAATMEQLRGKIAVVEEVAGKSNIFLFQLDTTIDLFSVPWLRAGLPAIRLDTGEEVLL
jgi:hypothetical protein